MDDKTKKIHEWMKYLPDDQKLRFAINWGIPHSLFNVACTVHSGGQAALQGINWYEIHKSRDMGLWAHGGPVIVSRGRGA